MRKHQQKIMQAACAFIILTLLVLQPALAQEGWKIHDLNRPAPTVVTPGAQNLPVPPPSDAVVLFDGTDLSEWEATDGSETMWVLKDGVMESVAGAGYIQTRKAFGDVQLHIEWASPSNVIGNSQGRGNSGVFLMGKYEVQVLDSYNNPTYPDGQAGAVYGQSPPLVNASRGPGEWQTYDIIFRRPRFNTAGKVISPARVTVLHNGVLVQDNFELWGGTEWQKYYPYEPHADKLPLAFQDHGNPVRFRNIWLRELDEGHIGMSHGMLSMDEVSLDDAQLNAVMGRYTNSNGGQYEVIQDEDGHLIFIQTSGRPFRMLARSATTFELSKTAGLITFEKDDEGNITGFLFEMGGGRYPAKRAN